MITIEKSRYKSSCHGCYDGPDQEDIGFSNSPLARNSVVITLCRECRELLLIKLRNQRERGGRET